jgi:hypothetical protein
VEAELHDLDCNAGIAMTGTIRKGCYTVPERVSAWRLFEQQQCNYEQSFDQVFPAMCRAIQRVGALSSTAAAASSNSAASGRCTAMSNANQIVNVNG